MKVLRVALLVAVALVLTVGCASQPIEQQLTVAAAIHAGTTRSVTAALDAEIITSNDAGKYYELAVTASEILNSARDLKDSDPTTAQGKIELVNGVLKELEAFL